MTNGFYCVTTDSKSVEHLNSVTKESLIEFYKEYVQVHSPTRSKLAVYIIGTHLDSCEFLVSLLKFLELPLVCHGYF